MSQHFVNEGYGWTCRRCEDELKARASEEGARARFFSEGEAEEKEPQLTARALARWRDAEGRELFCPRCGIVEALGNQPSAR